MRDAAGATAAGGRAAVVVLIGAFCLGLLGEGLLFIHRQLGLVEAMLARDFHLIAIPRDGRADAALEARLATTAGVAGVLRVTGKEALARLGTDDPELAQVLSRGPKLPDSYQIVLSAEALGSMTEWAQALQKAEPGLELRYKPLQAAAVLQVRFYQRFLALAGLIALAGLALIVLAARGPWAGALVGALGGLLGAAVGLAIAYPLRSVSPLWAWPDWYGQALIACGGALDGWRRHGLRRL